MYFFIVMALVVFEAVLAGAVLGSHGVSMSFAIPVSLVLGYFLTRKAMASLARYYELQ